MTNLVEKFLAEMEDAPEIGDLEHKIPAIDVPDIEDEVAEDQGLDKQERELVNKNLGLAGYFAKKFMRTTPEVEYNDIFQMAAFGLAKAAKAWNRKPEATKSVFPFNRYASRTIANYVKYQYFTQKKYAAHELKTLDAPAEFEDGGSTSSNKDMVRDTPGIMYKASAKKEDDAHGDEDNETTTTDKDADDTGIDHEEETDEESNRHGVTPNPTDLAATNAGANSVARKEAYHLVHKAIKGLPEPDRSILKKWMSGESYRDMEKEFGMSFAQIGNYARRGFKTIKLELEGMGITNLNDVLPESLEDGRKAYNMLIESIVEHKTKKTLVDSILD